MESKRTDLRVQKTQHQIKEALLELLEEQPFDSITVSRISERAMISRSTFYDHYPDKYTLLEHMYDEIEEQLIAITDAYFSEKGSDYRMELAGKILRYVLDNARLFRILLSDTVPPRNLLQLLLEVLQPRCLEYLKNHPNKYGLDNQFVTSIYTSIIYICLQWVAGHQDPADIDRILALSLHVGKLFYD